MIVEVIDHADNQEKDYYIIPFEIGNILKRAFGNDIYNPPLEMGEKLYNCYMSFCLRMEDIQVKQADITFHLC